MMDTSYKTKNYDFSDETQLHYEWVCDVLTDALQLLWERGAHDQEEKDLEKQWKAIEPILESAFHKARLYDLSETNIKENKE